MQSSTKRTILYNFQRVIPTSMSRTSNRVGVIIFEYDPCNYVNLDHIQDIHIT